MSEEKVVDLPTIEPEEEPTSPLSHSYGHNEQEESSDSSSSSSGGSPPKSKGPVVIEVAEKTDTETPTDEPTTDETPQKPTGKNAPWEHSPAGLTKRQVAFTVLGLMLGMFLAALDSTIVATALPAIVADFGRLDLYSWVIIAYLLTSTTIIPLAGRVSDIFGRKILFMGSIVLFLVGSALCGAAPSMITLIIFRAIQGLGGGALMSLTLIIIGDIVSLQQRGKFAGVFGINFALASVLGPVLGGVITDRASWRWVFYINLPIGIVALVVLFFFLRIPGDKVKMQRELFLRIDYLGAGSLVVGIVLILMGISLGGQQFDWNSAAIICFFVFGGVSLGVFGWWETRAKFPIIPLRLFLIRNIGFSNILIFTFGYAMFGSISYLPIYFQVVVGDSPTISGLKLLPLMVGLVGASMASGIVISKTGRFWIFPILAGAFLVPGLGLIGGLLTVDINIYLLSFFLLITGTGIGFVIQAVTVICQFAVDKKDMAVATATVTFTRTIGGVIGTTIFGVILNNRLSATIPAKFIPLTHAGHNAIVAALPAAVADSIFVSYTEALRTTFWAAAPVAAVGFLTAFAIKNVKMSPQAQKEPQHIEMG